MNALAAKERWTVSRRLLEPVQRDAIVQSLLDYHGSKVKTAESLGVSRAAIYRKIHQYGIITRASYPAMRPRTGSTSERHHATVAEAATAGSRCEGNRRGGAMLSAAAHPRALTDGDRLAVARKRFLSGESVAPDEVRETILASWQRSPQWNAAAGHIELPYVRDPNLDTPLARSALPMLLNLRKLLKG